MHCLLYLLVILARAAPDANSTVLPPNTASCCYHTSTYTTMSPTITTMSPTVTTVSPTITTIRSKPLKTQGNQRHVKTDSTMLNHIFDSYATNNKHFHDKFKAPSFESEVGSDEMFIQADTGSTVLFDCKVSSLRDKTVAWLRVSENDNLELLTLDLETHTADSRYRMEVAGDNWRLALSEARVQDTGLYCCQVSTHPPLLRRIRLTVHPPVLQLNKETFLESGETLSLKCAVLHLHPGNAIPSIHWYRGNKTVPLDEVRGGVLIDTDHISLTSQLQVADLTPADAGNYTCALLSPILMRSTTRVHVLQGSSLAELQSGVKTISARASLFLTSIFVALSSTVSWDNTYSRIVR